MTERKGYYTNGGYSGYVGNGLYMVFASENDYLDFMSDSETETETEKEEPTAPAGISSGRGAVRTSRERAGAVRRFGSEREQLQRVRIGSARLMDGTPARFRPAMYNPISEISNTIGRDC